MTDMDNDTNWDEELESLNDQEEVLVLQLSKDLH